MSRALAEKYSEALSKGDFEALGHLRHTDYVARWPQSGEIVRGHDKWTAIAKRHWTTSEGETEISGGSKVTVTPVRTPLPFGPPILAMSGGSDTFTLQGLIRYPDGSEWYRISICDVREEKVFHETTYFCKPFDPPDWRADLVELET